MSMQVIVFNSRVVLRPTIRTKIKCRLKEGVRLIVTRGAGVEESRRWLKIAFRAEAVGADKDCAWCVCVPPSPSISHKNLLTSLVQTGLASHFSQQICSVCLHGAD